MKAITFALLLVLCGCAEYSSPVHTGPVIVRDVQAQVYQTLVVIEHPGGYVNGIWACQLKQPLWKEMRVSDIEMRWNNRESCYEIMGAQR